MSRGREIRRLSVPVVSAYSQMFSVKGGGRNAQRVSLYCGHKCGNRGVGEG